MQFVFKGVIYEDTNGGYLHYENYYTKSQIPLIDTDTCFTNMKNKTTEDKDNLRHSPPEVLFFLGAGASVPAGISAIVELVDDFKKWLAKERKKRLSGTYRADI
jgi:hypothetical protein